MSPFNQKIMPSNSEHFSENYFFAMFLSPIFSSLLIWIISWFLHTDLLFFKYFPIFPLSFWSGKFLFYLLSPILHLKFVAIMLMSKSFFLFSVPPFWRHLAYLSINITDTYFFKSFLLSSLANYEPQGKSGPHLVFVQSAR